MFFKSFVGCFCMFKTIVDFSKSGHFVAFFQTGVNLRLLVLILLKIVSAGLILLSIGMVVVTIGVWCKRQGWVWNNFLNKNEWSFNPFLSNSKQYSYRWHPNQQPYYDVNIGEFFLFCICTIQCVRLSACCSSYPGDCTKFMCYVSVVVKP